MTSTSRTRGHLSDKLIDELTYLRRHSGTLALGDHHSAGCTGDQYTASPLPARGGMQTHPGVPHVRQDTPRCRASPSHARPALNDSPTGLLAWVMEKYRAWSDRGGNLSTRFTDDFVLTQTSLYWVTGTISTSFRPNYELPRGGHFAAHEEPGLLAHD